jgi:hypothetical protein
MFMAADGGGNVPVWRGGVDNEVVAWEACAIYYRYGRVMQVR